MENQHRLIKGYRELSPEEVEAMNEIKAKAEEVGQLIEKLSAIPSTDKVWVNDAKLSLQTGFMYAVRAVAQPTTF